MRTRTLRSLPAFLAIASIAAFSACSDNTLTGTQSVGGSYSLQTVNGTNVPYSYVSGGTTITIQNDVYTLSSDGSYSESINETLSNGNSSSPASDAEAGTWYQSGNAIVFSPNYSTQGNSTQYTGSIAGGGTFSHSSITFSYNGVVWVYNHT